MSEATLALQGAIFATLKGTGNSPPTPIIDRVYDRVPENPTFPYVTIGDDQAISDRAECFDGSVEAFSQIHVWSRAVGKVEAKTISGIVVRALNAADLGLGPDYRLVLIEHQNTQHLGDPDGLTSHSVITFRALIDEE